MGVLRITLVLTLAGCFSPSLDGRYRCGPDGSCPPDLVCASDGVCRALDRPDGATGTTLSSSLDGGDDDLASMPAPHEPPMMPGCMPRKCGDNKGPGGGDKVECGQALDGCGGTITCEQCKGGGERCGVGGPNRCGKGLCLPRDCAAQQAECGLVSDTCSIILNCGSCPSGQTCGAVTPNRCD